MKKIWIFITTLALSAFLIFLGADIPEKQSFDRTYVLLEADTMSVLKAENADKKVNVGYLSKLMSLLLVAEDIETGKYALDDKLSASENVSGTKGAVVWIEAGDSLTVEELLKSVIIGNANDAMLVLAEASEQTAEKFVKRMNAKAFDIGLRNTAFYSPCGYYDEREYTTAYDIAVVCACLTEYDFLCPYFSTWRDFVKKDSVELVNENVLSRTYEPHIGFKLSHSEKNGYCIAEGGKNENGMICIGVVLGADSENTAYSEVKKLLKSGFSNFSVVSTMFPDEMLMPLKVRNGESPAVEIVLERQADFAVPNENSDTKTVIIVPEYIDAPVKRGQRIGTAAFYNGKTLMYESPIIVKSDVKRLSVSFVVKKMLAELTEKLC